MLKQLKLMKSLEMKRAKLKEIETKYNALMKRSEDAKAALEEAKNEEDLKVVEAEITEIEKEETQIEEEKKEVEVEITQLEADLKDINERTIATNKKQTREHQGAGDEEKMNRIQVRELLKSGEYYKRSDVKEFYEKFKNLRAVTGGELTVPEVVVNRIMDLMGDFSTLYPLVDKIRVNGTARIVIDTDADTPATWLEQGAPLPVTDTGTIVSLSFDGFKLGKITFIDNFLLQDSIVNLDEYTSRKIAKAISVALDAAILDGTGTGQPTGIIPSLPVENVVDLPADATLAEIVAPVGLVDTGLDSTGIVNAVMRRSTYYSRFLPYSINVDANGNTVGKLPNLTQPDLLGLPVVFNNSMAADEVLYGDFQKYTLVERETITIDSSDQVRFVEDQTGFRGKGRFDGKPVKPEAFALIRLGVPAV